MNKDEYKEYFNQNYKRISLMLNKEKDKDIIENLDSKNIQGSIKALIRLGIESKEECLIQ